MLGAIIFAIGEEILDGSIVDTNSSFIAKNLLQEGILVKSIQALPDDVDIISAKISDALKEFPLVITTGGLGPTFDDLTPEAVANACGLKTVLNEEAYAHMIKCLASYGVEPNEGHKHQSMLPEGSKLLQNLYGTAMGFISHPKEKNIKSFVVSLPGVPYEMCPMMKEFALPYIKKHFVVKKPYIDDLRFSGVPESVVDDVIKKVTIPKTTKCIINASIGEVIVRIRDNDHSTGSLFASEVEDNLRDYYFGRGSSSISKIVVESLKKSCKTLAVAESCTGGKLGAEITSIPGSSEVFCGGVIAYDNIVKEKILNIPQTILRSKGAVSEECAIHMASGARTVTGASSSIAITGIAGPEGGTTEKPVGTVYIAISVGNVIRCKRYGFKGERDNIRKMACKIAQMDLLCLLKEQRK